MNIHDIARRVAQAKLAGFAMPVYGSLGTQRGFGDKAQAEMWLHVKLSSGNVVPFEELEKAQSTLLSAADALNKALKKDGHKIGHKTKPSLLGGNRVQMALRIDAGKAPAPAKQRKQMPMPGPLSLSSSIHDAMYRVGIKEMHGRRGSQEKTARNVQRDLNETVEEFHKNVEYLEKLIKTELKGHNLKADTVSIDLDDTKLGTWTVRIMFNHTDPKAVVINPMAMQDVIDQVLDGARQVTVERLTRYWVATAKVRTKSVWAY